MGISGLLKYTSNDLAVQIKNLRDWGSDPRGLIVGMHEIFFSHFSV